jgi:hypothetical protein
MAKHDRIDKGSTMATLQRIRRNLLSARKISIVASRPSWVSGAARLVDLGGVFDHYAVRISPAKTDAEAIAGDWAHVGADLTYSLQTFQKPK